MTIAEIGEKCSISTDTLRYYERIGLIPPIFIKCMRSAGIPVETLIEYVALFQHGKDSRETRKKILKEQRDILAERMAEMQQTLEKLDFKIANYDELVFEAEKKLSQQRYNNG